MREPDTKFPGKNVIRCNLIYGWRRGDIYLYIGQTRQGLARISTHNIVGIVEPILDTDFIDVWYVEKKELKKIETYLIHEFKPRYNIKCKMDYMEICHRCSVQFIAKGEGQIYCSFKCRFPNFKPEKDTRPQFNIITGKPIIYEDNY